MWFIIIIQIICFCGIIFFILAFINSCVCIVKLVKEEIETKRKRISIAKYNGKYYLYDNYKRSHKLITYQESKATYGFIYNGDYYYKIADEDELFEIFKLELLVLYNKTFPNHPSYPCDTGMGSLWKIEVEDIISKNTAVIRSENGIIPGWVVVGNNKCSKEIDLYDISNAVAMYTYAKIDGNVCRGKIFKTPQKVNKALSVSETIELCKNICRENI